MKKLREKFIPASKNLSDSWTLFNKEVQEVAKKYSLNGYPSLTYLLSSFLTGKNEENNALNCFGELKKGHQISAYIIYKDGQIGWLVEEFGL